jgi:hypothetical protein
MRNRAPFGVWCVQCRAACARHLYAGTVALSHAQTEDLDAGAPCAEVAHGASARHACSQQPTSDASSRMRRQAFSQQTSFRGAKRRGISLRLKPQERFLASLGMTKRVGGSSQQTEVRAGGLLVAAKPTQRLQFFRREARCDCLFGSDRAIAKILSDTSRHQRRRGIHHHDIPPRAVFFVVI